MRGFGVEVRRNVDALHGDYVGVYARAKTEEEAVKMIADRYGLKRAARKVKK